MRSLSNLWHVFHLTMSYFLSVRWAFPSKTWKLCAVWVHPPRDWGRQVTKAWASKPASYSQHDHTSCPRTTSFSLMRREGWTAEGICEMMSEMNRFFLGERLLTAAGGLFAPSESPETSIRLTVAIELDFVALSSSNLSAEVTPEVLPTGLTLPRKAPLKGTAMYLPFRRAFPSDLLGELHPSTLLFLRPLVICKW